MIVPDVHLGVTIAALVDGELSPAARDRALAHAAGCARCRSALDEERRIRARLRQLAYAGLASVPPAPATSDIAPGALPPGLLDRLARISASSPCAVGVFSAGGGLRPPSWPSRPDRSRPGTGVGREHQPAPVRRAVALSSALAAGFAAVIMLGSGSGESGPTLVPVGSLVDQHEATVREVPLYDATLTAVTAGLRR